MTALPRLPTKEDFPPSSTLTIIPPSSGPALNILFLLHGLGDTNNSFTTLGKNLNLPSTAYLSLQAPNPIPSIFTGSEAPSFHWGDDILLDEGRGEIDLDSGFSTSSRLLNETIGVLISKCQYPSRNIFFLGYGQGGMTSLSFIASRDREEEFGGVVSIGAGLSGSVENGKGKARTPVLVCGGSRSTQVTKSTVGRLKEGFADVEYVKWEKGDDGMMRNREEMVPVMRFFARRLRSRAGVPEGAVEIG